MSRGTPTLLALGCAGLALAACGGAAVLSPAERGRALALRVEAGDARAGLDLALTVARSGEQAADLAIATRGAALAAEQGLPGAAALHARLLEARGQLKAASARWMDLLAREGEDDWARIWAGQRLLRLVDRVPIDAAAIPRLRALLGGEGRPALMAAELLEAWGLRLRDDALLEEARERLGVVRSYQRTSLISRLPAHGLSQSAPLVAPGAGPEVLLAVGLSTAIATPDGTIAFSEDGPGVFVARLTPPALVGPLELELISDAAVRVFADGRELPGRDGLRALSPQRVVVALPAEGVRSIELHVGDRQAAPRLRAFLRPLTKRAGVTRPAPAELLALAALEDALFRLDAAALNQARDHVAWPLAAPELVRALEADETLPQAVAASLGRRLLEDALEVLPGAAQARAWLVRVLLSGGESARAGAVLRAGEIGELGQALALELAHDQGEQRSAMELAQARAAELPHSCAAVGALLDTGWERLRFGDIPGTPGCTDLLQRLTGLLIEGWRLDEARTVAQSLLERSAPGAERVRTLLLLGRIAHARADYATAIAHARAALREGSQREAALEQLLRAHRLAGDSEGAREALAWLGRAPHISALGRRRVLDPGRDLGLPLSDGHQLALDTLAGEDEGGAEEGAKGATAHTLLDEHHVSALPDGTLVHRRHQVKQLLDEGAVEELGEIPIPDSAEVLIARTWKPTGDGRMQPIEPEEMVEKSTISLAALEKGAVAEVAWFWIEPPESRIAPNWLAGPFFFESERARVKRARLILRTPKGAPVRVDGAGGIGAPEVREQGGSTVRVWTISERPRRLPEPLDPRPDLRLASVRLSSDFDLDDMRALYREALGRALMVTPSIEKAAREISAKAKTPVERLAAMHAYVLDQIQDGDETLFGSIASFSLASRAGERSVLLTALGRALDLPCDIALVRPKNRGSHGVRELRVVDPDDFVYPVVRVVGLGPGGGDLWIDTATRFVPFGYLPPLVQRTEALNLGQDGPTLLETPDLEEAQGERRVVMEVDVDASGRYVATGREELTGLFAMGWRHVLAAMEPAVRERVLSGVVAQSLLGVVVEETGLDGLEGRDAPLRLRWRATGELGGEGNKRALTLGLSPEGLGRSTVVLAQRRTPLFIERAGNLQLEVRVRLPEGASFAQPPEPAAVEHPLMALRREVQLGESTLTITKRFLLRLGTVTPEGYEAWARAARLVDRADVVHLPVTLPTGGAAPQ